MIYSMVPFPVTVSDTLRSWGYHRCPRRFVCAADARSVCDS